jgi:hypothetical protein
MVKEMLHPHPSLYLTNPQLAVARPTAATAVPAMKAKTENPENSPQQSFFLLYSARR